MSETRRCVHAKAEIVVHPNEGETDEEAIQRALGELNPRGLFEIVETWEEDE